MGHVTGLVLVCSAADEGTNFDGINTWLTERKFAALVELANRNAVGSKHPEICVYVAGYNYFPDHEFVAFFRSLRWYVPDRCVLVLTPEGDDPACVVRSDTEPFDI